VLQLRRDITGRLSPAELAAIRSLLDEAFDGDFDDHDWRHSTGGVHVTAWIDGRLVAHASVVERTLWCGATPYRTGYVEAVAVAPTERGSGFGTAVMTEVARIIRDGYQLGALSTSDAARSLYARLGWLTWVGPSHVEAPAGRLATPDEDGAIMVLAPAGIDLTAPITCDWRTGDVW
jgi:aminoglycoside 2'-N-acetyltransferase I